MRTPYQLFSDTVLTGGLATAATTAVAAACGSCENGSPWAPINAVSHIPFGDEAAEHDEPSVRYTATGALLNAAAVSSWAALHELAVGDRAHRGDVAAAVVGGVATAALAYVVDYHVVPRRLTPGVELRLSNRSLGLMYGALALSLAVGSLCRRE